ncbi:hypothetical protein [Deinococcus multiflagellatus]|uniref:Tetratricopeptide repeat protein n=2 Tax=Deinococcus multiflagellatus TaxID=1656887 RepID=A0ABW1ZLX5_9DEIO
MSAPCAPWLEVGPLPPGTPPHLLEQVQGAASGEARALALVELARAVRELSLDAALGLGERALDEALRADSPRAAVLALVGLGFVGAALGLPARALDAVTRAQALVQEHALGELRSAVVNVRALIRVISGNLAGAARDLQSALDLARHSESPLDYGHALGNLAWVANLRGDAKGALHHLNLLEEYVHDQPDDPQRAGLLLNLHETRAHAYVVLGREAQRLGRPDAAQQAAQQGLMVLRAADAAVRRTPNPTTTLLCDAHRAALRLLCGDLDSALDAAHAAWAMNRHLQQRLYLEPLLCLPEVLAARGERQAALAGYREALTLIRAQGRHRETQQVLQQMSALHEALGDPAAALQALREALADAQAAQEQISEDAQWHLSLELRWAQADASSWQDRLRHAEVQARQDP